MRLNNVPRNLLLSIKDRQVYLNRYHIPSASYVVAQTDADGEAVRLRIEIEIPNDSYIIKDGTAGLKMFLLSFKNE